MTQREINILFFGHRQLCLKRSAESSVGKYLLNPIENGVRTTWPVAIPMKWLLIHGVLALRVSSCVCVCVHWPTGVYPGLDLPIFSSDNIIAASGAQRCAGHAAVYQQHQQYTVPPCVAPKSTAPKEPATEPINNRPRSFLFSFFFCLVFLFICYSILFLFSPPHPPKPTATLYKYILFDWQSTEAVQSTINSSFVANCLYVDCQLAITLSTAVETINSFIDYQ